MWAGREVLLLVGYFNTLVCRVGLLLLECRQRSPFTRVLPRTRLGAVGLEVTGLPTPEFWSYLHNGMCGWQLSHSLSGVANQWQDTVYLLTAMLHRPAGLVMPTMSFLGYLESYWRQWCREQVTTDDRIARLHHSLWICKPPTATDQ